ncbi:iron-containing alcohol dehydrogenase [Paraburkholderia antibiotica]|uniref:Iron-containing alcohol dehydrogenase n=1 Tax=Paraburkholderia antibiotica TaxID=2728839 RepID=A0A7X9X7E9_9BURK|nr:iron-containing alcohol dehydrogenase [Paraburkholderia antibiotica]NML32879.1 iron-containing alcohol dehydrogenase [Paraburkholderia antibiotica]
MNVPSLYACPTKIYMGRNALGKIEDAIQEFACDRLFIAIDDALLKSALFERITTLLNSKGIAFEVFSGIEPDPSANTVARAFDVAQKLDAQAVLAIGGGSTMDVAKAVAILATNGGRIHDYEGIDKFKRRPLPRIAIPTTAGTGSEVSGSCVITDTEQNRKMSIRHALFNPADIAILDPLAVSTVPAHVAAHSGIDAFVHAFESYISLQANPITDALNLYAIELLSRNLRPFVAQRTNEDAALAMLCGSTLAGMTFGITGLGNVHCMARFVGTELHLSHGLSNALCLPTVAEFNLAASPARFARIALAMGCNVQGRTELEAARDAVQAIRDLCMDLGIPPTLREVGAKEEMLEPLARLAADAGYNRWNPRHTTFNDFLRLFRQAY